MRDKKLKGHPMTSFAISPYTSISAINSANNFLNNTDMWQGSTANVEQIEWLHTFNEKVKDIPRLTEEIEGHATNDPLAHRQWMSARGFPSQLSDGGVGGLYLAAVLDVICKWAASVTEFKDSASSTTKKGICIEEAFCSFTWENNPVVRIPISDDTQIFVGRTPNDPSTRNELLRSAQYVMDRSIGKGRHVNLQMPMVDLSHSREADYLIGLRKGDWSIHKARESFHLKINETGARARAAVEAIAIRSIAVRPDIIKIEEPFLLVIEKKGCREPIFAAFCDRDCWGDPGSL